MKRVSIPELNAECYLVSSYADLRKQGDVTSLVLAAYLNPLSMPVRLELLRKLFLAPERVWETLLHEENREELWRLTQQLDWVWKGPDCRPLDRLKLRGRRYFLPDEQLHQLTTAEFVIATAHLIGFWQAKTEELGRQSLALFLTTILRPKPDVLQQLRQPSPNGDLREPFHSVRCEQRAGLFGRIDLVTQILLAQWFNNAANRLLKNFGMNAEDASADQALINQGIFVQDWERQVVKVAESGVYGNYDSVMARPIPDVLAYIDLKNDERKTRQTHEA